MVKSKLLLPIDDNGNPNYKAMEEYIKQKINVGNSKIKNYTKCKIEELKGTFKDVISLSEKKQDSFKIVDLFDPKRGNQNNMESLTDGDIPLISAKNINILKQLLD